MRAVVPEIDALFGVPQPVTHHPEVDTGVHVLQAIDYSAAAGYALPVRYAVLAHDLGKAASARKDWPRHIGHEQTGAHIADQMSDRIRAPIECRDLARLAARFHGVLQRAFELRAATMLDLLLAADSLRRPERLTGLVEAGAADVLSRPGPQPQRYAQGDYVLEALTVVRAVDAGAIAASLAPGGNLPLRIRAARIKALREWKKNRVEGSA